MTAQDICDKYGYSINSLTTNFNRVAASILKKHGVRIIKEGRGKNARYMEIEDDRRALTMYEEVKDIAMNQGTISLANWDLLALVAICCTPMLVFRGSYREFLGYVEIGATAANIKALKLALIDLQNREYIMYQVDKTNEDYFMAGLYHAIEEELGVGISTIRQCKQLADKYHKHGWLNIFKTYVGMQVLQENQPFTVAQLSEYTGLSEYMIRESTKILEAENMIKTDIKYYKGTYYRLGREVEFNALKEGQDLE